MTHSCLPWLRSLWTVWLLAIVTMSSQAADPIPARRPAWTTSRITGTPEAPSPYRLALAFPKHRFAKPTSIEVMPTAKRMLVTEMGGNVFTIPLASETERADLLVDLRKLLPADLAEKNVALFDAELHPRFSERRFLFLCYVHPGDGGHTRVSRFTVAGDSTGDSPPRIEPNSEQLVITWPAGGHNGGCLEFGADGMLYIATGDGSGPNPPDGLTTGQTVTDLLGAILRIDVDATEANRPYRIPADNPFVHLPGARPEIWAYGLRNPWKFGIDPQFGNLFAADNGWESWEMVHKIVRGGNCGWPVREGRAALRTEVTVGPTPILPPVKDHPHTEANSVIGGPVYRGDKLPGLNGSFVYGDYITGTIWAIRPDADGAYSHTTLVDTDQRIIAFTRGPGDELFVLDYDYTGQIYELLPNDKPDRSAHFPRRLSETGLFTSLENLKPAPGVVPYRVIAARWDDGAIADRWVAIPGDGQIEMPSAPGQTTTYPDGTVFVKHLTLSPSIDRSIRLETQLLHLEDGVWRPYSYLWDEDGRDARLVESIGARRTLQVADPANPSQPIERTWHVNAVNECKLCHEAAAGVILGFTPRQLQLTAHDQGPKLAEQLAALTQVGVLAAPVNLAPEDSGRLVDPHDTTQSLDDRARSYLHANCGMCHHPAGNAIVSFYLRRDLPFEKLNTNKGTGIGTFGMRDAKVIVPGDPYRSVLFYRMSKLGYARMPYIGSHVVDSAGVALIDQWIRAMPTDPHPATSSDAAKTEEALRLVAKLHGGSLAASEVRAIATRESTTGAADVRGLFETFLPEAHRRKTLGGNIDPQTILSLRGDRDRGKLIFFSDGARCRACHDALDRDKSVGPTLQEINKKYAKPAELLQHVLQPSQKIDEPFAAYTAATGDGRVLTGLLVERSAETVVLKSADRQLLRLAAKDIDELRKSEKSLMPERLLADLTAQEAADLLEYLRTVVVAPAANEPSNSAVNAAIRRSIPLLEKGAAGSIAERANCFTCHNQGVPIIALTAARARGFAIDEPALRTQLEFIAKFLDKNRDRFSEGKGTGGQVATAGTALWALEAGVWKSDAATAAVTEYLLQYQKDLGAWKMTSHRPPTEHSHFTANYLAVRGLKHFAAATDDARTRDRIEKARRFFLETTPQETEDRVFQLWGLAITEADVGTVRDAAAALVKSQRADGGWAQTADLESDAYATATALVALHQTGQLASDAAAYRRGVQFLLSQQKADGSWHVRSRSKPFQTYFESGYPHGTDQFISITAASWATMALALGQE